MFSCISKKHFSSKLYANVANLQRQKTIKLTINSQAAKDLPKNADSKANSNTENYLKAYSTANENKKKAEACKKKLQDIQNHINNAFLKTTNKINYQNYEPSSADLDAQFTKKSAIGRELQEKRTLVREQDSLINSLKEYSKVKENLATNKQNIAECEEIMDLAAKLSNEKYSAKAEINKQTAARDLSVSGKNNSQRTLNLQKQTVLKNAHVYELYYYTAPFANSLLSPHKYKEPFGTLGRENISLRLEFEHEQDSLNSEIHSKLVATVEQEMNGFRLSDIKSNISLFKDPIKNMESVGYLIEESNRLVDYDYGLELERLFYVINKEDDFGATMYKEEGDKKKQNEKTNALTTAESPEDSTPIRETKHFPFTVDAKAFVLAKNSVAL